MSIGEDLMLSLARDILAGTPEAKIAAAESAKEISEAMADEMRNALKVEEEATRMAERIGEAMITEIENQRDAVLDQIKDWRSSVEDAIGNIYSAISGQFSEEDAREAVSDQQRSVAEAEADLLAARADPSKSAKDIDALEERLTDAQRGLRRDNFRLFEMLMKQSGGAMATADMLALGGAAGLSEAKIWELRNQYTALGNANSSATSWGNMLGTGDLKTLTNAIATAIAMGMANVTFTIDGQVIDVRVDNYMAGVRTALGAR